MPLRQLNPASSEPPRHRRQATACISCRNRRVRCDRMRPTCIRCSKRSQVCEYIITPPARIEFITEPLSSAHAATRNPTPPSETWNSVFESQITLVETPGSSRQVGQGQEVPLWILAEIRTSKQSSQENPPASLDPAVCISFLGEPFLSIFFDSLASRETYLPYFENYLATIHPLLPFYPVSNMRQTYMEFWDNLSLSTSAELLALILAILYTGAANEPSSQNDSATIYTMYDKIITALDLPTYQIIPTPSSLWLLHGMIIMNTFRASHLAPFTAFGFLPFAIRFAQSLQLHIHQEKLAPVDSEALRGLWWHLVFMDVESTIASGLDPIIRPNRQIILLPTFDVTTIGGDRVPLTPVAIAMQGHWELTHRMQNWLERKPEQHEIIHFGRIIEHLLELILERDESKWARLYLRMLVDRAYCMLGLRFWQLDQFKGTNCHSEVVRTSRSFLQKFLQLAELSRELGFSWFIPDIVQPIHALMILLVHLSACPHPDEESKLSRELIDQVILLRITKIPNGSIAHLGSNDTPNTIPLNNARYRALSTLRMHVWQKFKWPIAVQPSLPDYQQDTGIVMKAAGFSQADLDAAGNLNHLDQGGCNECDNTSSMPSSTPGWDDWGPFLPNFFAD